MATVRAGWLDGRPVAVKILAAERAEDPAFVRAFRAEIRAMATLCHPNVVRVYDFGVAKEGGMDGVPAGSPWVVMERADGVLAAQCGRNPWPVAREWLEQLLAGLAHAHARGITHRDLKPANVLLADGVVKLADFGLARAFESVASGVLEQPAGTPGYMPPEQRQGRWRDIGPWTDLYALGRVALDLVSLPRGGTVPVPSGFAAWVARLRQERSLDRYRRAADALAALRAMPEASAPLEGVAGGMGPAADSDAALTEPYFEDKDSLVTALPDPLPVALARAPERPLPELAAPSARGVGLALARPTGIAGLEPVAEALWSAVLRAWGGSVEVVALRGAADSGRRDLALWLCHQVHETGAGTVELATHDAHRGPRSGLGGLIARELRCFDLDRISAFERVSAWLRDHPLPERPAPAGDTWEAAALVAMMAPALGPGERSLVSLGPAEQRYELVARFLERDGEGRVPLVWLDAAEHAPESLAWVSWLRRRGGRFLVLVTASTGALDDALRAVGAEVHDLGPPSPARVERAVLRPLGVPAGPLAERIREACGADPVLARLALEDAAARGWTPTADAALPAPEIRPGELWRARLDRALAGRDRFARLAVGCAAVLGDEVNQVRWRDVCRRARVRLDDGLAESLMANGLAVSMGLGDAGDWRFASPGLVAVALDGVRGELPRLHRAAAHSYRVEPETALARAHHLEAAGDGEAAAAALLDAIEPMIAAQDGPGLRAVVERLAATVPAGSPRAEEVGMQVLVARLALATWEGRARDVLSEGPEVVERARPWPGAAGVAALLLGRCAMQAGDPAEAERRFEEVAALAGTRWDALAAEGEGYLGVLRSHQGRFREAVELLDRSDVRRRDPAVVLGTVILRARAYKGLGEPDRAERELESVRELAESAAGWITRAAYANALGELCRLRGDLDAASRHYAEAFAVARSAGHTNCWLYLMNLALVELMRGRDDEASDALERAVAALDARGHAQFAASGRLLSLVVAARRGDLAAWDAAAPAMAELERLGAFDRDLALAAELAADAVAPLDPERSERAAAFARRQRARLGTP